MQPYRNVTVNCYPPHLSAMPFLPDNQPLAHNKPPDGPLPLISYEAAIYENYPAFLFSQKGGKCGINKNERLGCQFLLTPNHHRVLITSCTTFRLECHGSWQVRNVAVPPVTYKSCSIELLVSSSDCIGCQTRTSQTQVDTEALACQVFNT